MTPQAELITDICDRSTNQGVAVTTVRCHPALQLQVMEALHVAHLDHIEVVDDPTIIGETIKVGGATVKAATAQRAGFSITRAVHAPSPVAPPPAKVGVTHEVHPALGFMCPWCDEIVTRRYQGASGDVCACEQCGMAIKVEYKIEVTVTRDTTPEIDAAYSLGRKAGTKTVKPTE